MENEFYIKSVKEKCTYYDITCKETLPSMPPIVVTATPEFAQAVKDANWKDAKMVLGPPYESIAYCPGFSQKTPGQKSVKIKLESNGSYDIEALKAAFDAGKKVKLIICA